MSGSSEKKVTGFQKSENPIHAMLKQIVRLKSLGLECRPIARNFEQLGPKLSLPSLTTTSGIHFGVNNMYISNFKRFILV